MKRTSGVKPSSRGVAHLPFASVYKHQDAVADPGEAVEMEQQQKEKSRLDVAWLTLLVHVARLVIDLVRG